jgi:beta-galactosidase
MRKIIPINNNWYFKANYEEGYEEVDDLGSFEIVNLPHTNIELPYNYFDEKMYQIKSCYKYPLNISEEYRGKAIYLHFEGVMAYAQIYLNGLYMGEHKGGYTPFDIRIDEAYDWKRELNMLTVVVDSTERSDIPPFGGQIDYLTYGGIYREVSLGIYDDIFIKNVKVETHGLYDEEKSLNLIVYIENLNQQSGNSKFKVKINEKNGKEFFYVEFNKYVDAARNVYSFNIENLRDIKLWDVDNPNLYEIKVGMEINNCSDEYIDTFGFREAVFKPDGFYLNGKKLKLRGLNRHQSYPYVGYAMPKRVQEKDAEILKNDLHLNIVRTSHYPQSKHFLNKCDELGLLVFEEIPGWQYIGNNGWKKVAQENLKEMIQRDWNHPSIILWGVRINESQDDDAFYKNMNKIAHEIDSTRQTGGVRYITNSSFLEDVYTFNDFIHDGINKPLRKQQEVTGLEYNVPYLVTEYNGHMYPTKRFDNEERQMEHCLRHLRVQNASYLDDSISGAIGWCAFDYNTHKDFGSGDRICYHGVMDMFRLPKFASYVYKSQVSPDVEPVLEPVTFWARGERSIGGVIPLVIFTNCDYIELQYGSKTKIDKIFPKKDEYKGIPYPPVIIDYSIIKPEEVGSWGMKWEDLYLRGFYKNNVVIEKKYSTEPVPTELRVMPDDFLLDASQKDATRIVVKILDQYGNLLPFINEVIKIEIEGPAKLQGPNEVALIGGAIAFWVETINESGVINIKVRSRSLGEKNVMVKVE